MTVSFRLFAISLLTATLGSCLFFSHTAHALVQQPIYDTGVSANMTGAQFLDNSVHTQNFISNPLETPTTTITSVTVYLKTNNTCGFKIKLTNTSLSTLSSSNVTTTAGVAQAYTFNFSANSNFHTGNLSKFGFDFGNSMGGCTLTADHSGYIYGSISTSSYSNGYWSTVGTTTPANAYFIINGSSASSWIAFANTPISTCNFQNFALVGGISTSTASVCGTTVGSYSSTGTCSVGVGYNAGTADSQTYIYNSNNAVGSFNTLNALSAVNIPKPSTFVSGTVYNARAYICSSNNASDCWLGANGTNSEILAQSNDWSFIVNGLDTCSTTYYSQFIIPSPSTSSVFADFGNILYQANQQCDAFRDGSITGGVAWGICKVMVSLLVPSQDSLNNFTNLKNDLSAKPPFGYITVYSTALDTLSNATSTTSTLSTVTSTAELQLSTWSQIGVFSQIRTAFEWFLYFVVGVWIFNRLRKLSLHG